MDYTIYGYIAAGIFSPMVFAWLVRSIKLIPSVVKDYFVAVRTLIFKPLQNVA